MNQPSSSTDPESETGAGEPFPRVYLSWRLRAFVTWSGSLAGLITILRLHLSNNSVWTDLLWAEDGLFALCSARDGLNSCLWTPYAGYLPWWPKLVSGLIGQADLSSWPALTLIAAAVTTGSISAFAAWILLRQGVRWWLAVFAALTPVLLPIFGEEAVGSVANTIYLLTYATTIGLAFPTRGRLYIALISVLGLLTAISTPIGLIFLPITVLQHHRGRLQSSKSALVVAGSVTLGVCVQFTAIIVDRSTRPIRDPLITLEDWVTNVWAQVLKVLPFLGSETWETESDLHVNLVFGTTFLFGILCVSIYHLVHRPTALRSGVSLMWITAVFASLIPHLANGSLARYFITPVSLWLVGALLLLCAHGSRRIVRLAVPAICVSLVAAWGARFVSPEGRSTASPPWSQVMDLGRSACKERPNEEVGFVFTPFWPDSPDGSREARARAAPCSIFGQGSQRP